MLLDGTLSESCTSKYFHYDKNCELVLVYKWHSSLGILWIISKSFKKPIFFKGYLERPAFKKIYL